YNGTATSRINQKIEDLRDTYATGQLHIAKQEKEKEKLTTDVSRLKKQIETSKQDIDNAKWLKRVLERFDCTFGDLEQELTQIVKLSDSFEEYESRANRSQANLSELESKVEKKQQELTDTLQGIEYYNKERFHLFRENKKLKDLVESGDV
ncbi:hypothetical protein AB4491_16310, partial [Vibrio sp. 10N.261.45.A7]